MTTQVQGKGKKKNKEESSQSDAPHGHSVVNIKMAGFDWAATMATCFDPINAYLAAVFLTGVIQLVYCLLVGSFPFNSFLAGFLSCVTSFVLAVGLKLTGQFKGFLFANLVLHLAVLMFIG